MNLTFWELFWNDGCQDKRYPLFKNIFPCDCVSLVLDLQNKCDVKINNRVIEYGLSNFHSLNYLGLLFANDLGYQPMTLNQNMVISKQLTFAMILNIPINITDDTVCQRSNNFEILGFRQC